MDFTKNQIMIAIGVLALIYVATRKAPGPARGVGAATDVRRIDNQTLGQNLDNSMGVAAELRALDNASPAQLVANTAAQGIPQYPSQQVF